MSTPNSEHLDYGRNRKVSSSLILSFTHDTEDDELSNVNEMKNSDPVDQHEEPEKSALRSISNDEIIEFLSKQINQQSVQFIQQIADGSFLIQLSKPKDVHKCIETLNNHSFKGKTFQLSQDTISQDYWNYKPTRNHYSGNYNRCNNSYNHNYGAYGYDNNYGYYQMPPPLSDSQYHNNRSVSFDRYSQSPRSDHDLKSTTSLSSDLKKSSSSGHNYNSNRGLISPDSGSYLNSGMSPNFQQQFNFRSSSSSTSNERQFEPSSSKKRSSNSSNDYQKGYPSFFDSFLLKQSYQNMFFQNNQNHQLPIPQSVSPIQMQHQMSLASPYMPMFYMQPSGIFNPQISLARSQSMPAIYNESMGYPYNPTITFEENNSKDDSDNMSENEESAEEISDLEKEAFSGNSNIATDQTDFSKDSSFPKSKDSDTDIRSTREKGISPQYHNQMIYPGMAPTNYYPNPSFHHINDTDRSYQNQQMIQMMFQMMNDTRNFSDPAGMMKQQGLPTPYSMYPGNSYYDQAYYQKQKFYQGHKNNNVHNMNQRYVNSEESPDVRRLFFGNLSYNTTLEDLKEEIHQRLGSSDIKFLIEMPNNELTKGFAIVQFSNPDVAENAIKRFNGTDFHGRKITVRYDRYPSFSERNQANKLAFQYYNGLDLPGSKKETCDSSIDGETNNSVKQENSNLEDDGDDTEKSRNLINELAPSNL